MIDGRIILFARDRLETQRRKIGGSCFLHSIEVAELSQDIATDLEMVNGYSSNDIAHIYTIGLLHDVLEDTDTSYDQIAYLVGTDIANSVLCLTEDKFLPYELRKELYRNTIESADSKVQTVKLADICSGLKSLVTADEAAEKWISNYKTNCLKLLGILSDDLKHTEYYKWARKCSSF